MQTTRLGPDGPQVTNLCVGTSPLGGMPRIYGYDVDAERAVATVRRFLESPITFLDTSNEYGDGESELRIGAALQAGATLPQGVVIASKADPRRGVPVFDGARVRESFRESVGRLGVGRLDVYYLHDPERFDFEYLTMRSGAVDAMRELKAEGLVGLIGVAGGSIPELHRYLDLELFDVVLNHNQYTLLDRSADSLIDRAVASGVAFVNAAPYASGILAKPLAAGARYKYRAPDPAIVETVRWLNDVCASFGVPLAALAVQFSTRDPRVSSTVVGVSSPERIDALVQNEAIELPQELWDAVEARLRPPSSTG